MSENVSTTAVAVNPRIRARAAKITARDFALALLPNHPDFYFFPITGGTKNEGMPKDNLGAGATNDPNIIKQWPADTNVGLAINKSGLFVVDVDCKPGKHGQDTFDDLDLFYGFPPTSTVATPSGGFHLYYRQTETVRHYHRQGEQGFGPDIDVTGYVLIPGSWLGGFEARYSVKRKGRIAPAPDWFAEFIKPSNHEHNGSTVPAIELDQEPNIKWAVDYLTNHAKPSIQGANGEKVLFDVAATLKDRGISEHMAVELIDKHYNVPGKCDPMWNVGNGPPADDLAVKVRNAYAYATDNAPGSKTPEAEFEGDAIDPVYVAKLANSWETRERITKADADNGDDDNEPSTNKRSRTLKELQDDFVYITTLKRFMNRRDPTEVYDVDGFNNAFIYRRGRYPSITKRLLETESIRSIKGVVYRPNDPEFTLDGLWNGWRPGPITPMQGDATLFDAHVKFLFPDGDPQADLLLNWLAGVLQNPGTKPRHQLLLMGRNQGTGKTFFARLMRALLGPSNCQPLTQDILENGFTGWAMHTKFVWVEEVRDVAGNRKVTAKLHSWASESSITINQKNLPTFPLDQVIAFMLMSNGDDPLALDLSDRRYVGLRTEAKAHPDGKAYYDALYGVNGKGGLLQNPDALAAIYYKLLHRDLGDYSIEHQAPVTEAKREAILAAQPPEVKWMLDHADVPPLCYRVVTLDEVVEAMPPRLQSRYAGERVREAVKYHFNGLWWPQQIRPHGRRGGKVRVWLLRDAADKGFAALSLEKQTGQKPSLDVLRMWREDRADERARADASAADDFGEAAE